MFKPLELFIGLRYTRAKRRNRFISFISAISMLGIAVGVTVLITVMSVMNGFEKELRERILGMVSHATISSGAADLTDWEGVIELASAHPEVVGAAPYIEKETMLKGYRVSGAIVRGILPDRETSVSDVGAQMVEGDLSSLEDGAYHIVLGADLALAMGVRIGDPVTVFAPQVRATPAGVLPQVKRFTVSGTYSVGMHEYDRGTALIHLADAARLFRTQDGVSGVRIKVRDLFQAWEVAAELRESVDGFYMVRDWTQNHANFFRAVQMEKTVMFVIMSLIIAVAAFNIISTLVMTVTDKQSDIAILRTLGASPASVMGIFVVLGVIIGLVGTGLGVLGGVLLASNVEQIVPWLEQTFNTQFLSSDIYYISDLPSDLRGPDVIKVSILAFLLSVVATLYPAWRASRTDPAEALRYE
ncbi:MAG: lipoprotein-releasing ABC transporter permease subunit [Xanthomonadales bacterium]|nr:lipoprotein-releasing ABC transporter permease subunit [Xanthomonadales bacterium]